MPSSRLADYDNDDVRRALLPDCFGSTREERSKDDHLSNKTDHEMSGSRHPLPFLPIPPPPSPFTPCTVGIGPVGYNKTGYPFIGV